MTKGLLVALLAGVMSACFALGLDAGTPIKEAALAGGVEGLYAGLPVIFLVTLGGFLTNAAYCLQQNVANKSMGDYAKGKVWGNNLVFCALAGVLWYMQFFGLEMGKSFLTESPVLLAFSWCILMALNVTFSNVWGIILKEWKGVSNKTITVLIYFRPLSNAYCQRARSMFNPASTRRSPPACRMGTRGSELHIRYGKHEHPQSGTSKRANI